MSVKKTRFIGASLAALALATTTALTGCASSDDDGNGDEAEVGGSVTLGVVGASDDYWSTFVDAAAEEDIEVELVDFADYNQPNPAVSSGDLDLNQFQHIVYLAEYNVANDDDLVPVGATAIYPLPLFSNQHDSVEEIPEGGEIAIPNDVSNRARALLVLQSAGLLTLEGGGSIFSTPAEIIEDESTVSVIEVQADLVPNSLDDVDGGVINNDYVTQAGLDFADALAQDDANDPNALPYANIFATRAEDADNPTFQRLVEIYQTNEEVQAGVFENSGDSAVLLTTPVEELVESLNTVQEDIIAEG